MRSVLQPLERRLGDLADALRPAVQAALGIRVDLEAELGRDDDLSRNGASASPTSSSFVNGP